MKRRKIWSSWQICLSRTKKMKSTISRKKSKITVLLPRNKQRPSQSKQSKSRKKKSSSPSKMLNKKSEKHQFSTNLITLNQTQFKMLWRTSPAVTLVKRLPKQPKLWKKLTMLWTKLVKSKLPPLCNSRRRKNKTNKRKKRLKRVLRKDLQTKKRRRNNLRILRKLLMIIHKHQRILRSRELTYKKSRYQKHRLFLIQKD